MDGLADNPERKRRRRQFRELEVVKTLLLQGVEITCPDCGKPITLADLKNRNVQKQHKHEFGLDGPDEPENCYFSHAARPCHAQVTHGSPATFAGSSRHKMKKATDPERIEKFVVKKEPPKPRQKTLDADRVSLPSKRCPGCGSSPGEDCTCPPKPQRSGFGQRRAA